MPNVKSAAKRVETSRKRALRNASKRSAMKTAIKRFEEALAAGSPEKVKTAFTRAVSLIDRAGRQGIIHKNAADRKKSRLAQKLNAFQNQAAQG